jgi:hypothetical protein
MNIHKINNSNKESIVFINGLPKGLLGGSNESLDRLSLSKQNWLSKHGNHLLNFDKNMAEESTKLFKFIDYERTGIITRSKLKLII